MFYQADLWFQDMHVLCEGPTMPTVAWFIWYCREIELSEFSWHCNGGLVS